MSTTFKTDGREETFDEYHARIVQERDLLTAENAELKKRIDGTVSFVTSRLASTGRGMEIGALDGTNHTLDLQEIKSRLEPSR